MTKGHTVVKNDGKKGFSYTCRVRYRGTEVSRTFKRKGTAQEWGRKTTNLIDEGKYSQFHGDLSNITFSKAIDKWLEEPDVLKHKSFDSERHRCNNIKTYKFSAKKLVDLKTSDFRDFRDIRIRTEEKAVQSVKNDFNIIKSVINTAISEWGFDGLINQANAVKFPKSEKHREVRLLPGEKESIFKYAANDSRFWLLPFPLVTSKHLSSGKGIDFSTVKYISGQDHFEICKRSEVQENDILFAMIGSIGNATIVIGRSDFSIKNVALFKPVSNSEYCPEYLHITLNTFTKFMKETASGGVQKFVSLTYLRNFPFPLPPLAEQKRIVAKVDELMALCDQLENQIKLSQTLNQDLMSSLSHHMTDVREPQSP